VTAGIPYVDAFVSRDGEMKELLKIAKKDLPFSTATVHGTLTEVAKNLTPDA